MKLFSDVKSKKVSKSGQGEPGSADLRACAWRLRHSRYKFFHACCLALLINFLVITLVMKCKTQTCFSHMFFSFFFFLLSFGCLSNILICMIYQTSMMPIIYVKHDRWKIPVGCQMAWTPVGQPRVTLFPIHPPIFPKSLERHKSLEKKCLNPRSCLFLFFCNHPSDRSIWMRNFVY